MKHHLSRLGLILAVYAVPAQATELVYTPINPNFGGNPLNGALLMNAALAQQDKDPATQPKTALEQFTESLQRSILSRISSAMSSTIVDPTSGALLPGTLETQDFVIDIVDLGGGLLRITTTDKVTSQSTSFEVSSAI
jgi:curli production assembly/transport component CsgF